MPTKNVLVPMDGSPNALRALKYAVDRVRDSQHTTLLLLNVQPGMPPSRHVKPAMIKQHHEQMSEEALEPARALAKKAGVLFDCYFRLGDPATVIASFAQRTKCREIVMGTRGLGRVRGLLLGSVATKVISLTDIPITLVK